MLTPDDYGMVGQLAIFSLIAATIQESGFTAALTNRPTVEHRDYNAVFWFCLPSECDALRLAFCGGALDCCVFQKRGNHCAGALSLSLVHHFGTGHRTECALVQIDAGARTYALEPHGARGFGRGGHRAGLPRFCLLGTGDTNAGVCDREHGDVLAFRRLASHVGVGFQTGARDGGVQQLALADEPAQPREQ